MSYIIGICGGSCSGKTTLAHALKMSLGDNSCALISLDNYYIDFVRLGTDPATVNYDHPHAFEFDLLYENLKELKSGKAIQIPRYNFSSHTREEETMRVRPKKYVIIEGLFLFNIRGLNKSIDLKIFIDLPESERYKRKTQRDIQSRGRSAEYIENQYRKYVLPMHVKYVEPNKQLADIVLDGNTTPEELLSNTLIKMKSNNVG